jgi:hypothetical protein
MRVNESEWSDPLSIVIPKQKMSTVNYDNWFYYPKLQNYAPKGMPDFDQRQESWQNSLGMQSFCGPTSVANVLWYIDSKYSDPLGYPGDGIDNYPLVQDYNAPSNPEPGPFSDDHNFNNVNDPATPWDSVNNTYGNEFIEKIAWYVDNDGVRTGGNHLGSTSNGICEGITQWIQDVELSNSFDIIIHDTIHKKSLNHIINHIECGDFIILNLGFYTTTGFFRGSHWVTVAGISKSLNKIVISDPYNDFTNITTDYIAHNDADIVSHDIFIINNTSPLSTKSSWWIEDYKPDYAQNTNALIKDAIVIAPIIDNKPPEKPTIEGPKSGKIEIEYQYIGLSNDINNDTIYYLWDWGDGNKSDWLGPYDSGENSNTSHIWFDKGNYEIRVKAKDIHGEESDWSDPLIVSIPRKKSFNPYLILNHNSINISWKKHIIDDSFDYAFGVYAFDLDKDGDCDVLGAAEEGDFIAWWRNEGGNPINWTKFIIDDDFDGATSVFAVDIDGDLDVDVVGSAWHDNEIALWRNEGGDPPNWIKFTIRSGFDFAHEVYCHDLDLDGDLDILGASTDDNQIAWWRNDGGNPISWTEQIISNNFLGAKSARVADIDNDGLLDIIGTAILDDKIIWWRNLGGEPLVWEENIIVDGFDGAHRVESCDMDLDGDIDIVGAAYWDGEISWWSNDGGTPVTWKKQVIASNFKGACIGLPVDIDEDGDFDVVGTAQQANDVALFRNDGGNPFVWTKIIIDPLFWGAWPGFVSDIDGDDDVDILVGASFGDKLAWWESDLSQKPFIPERPSGPTSGKPNIEYSYSSVTTDPQDDNVFYLFNWGDGNDSGWIGPFNSGEACEATHSWDTKGNYEIKVKAKDIYGSESDWSDPLPISMLKSKAINTPFLQLIENLLQNHPHLFSLLRQLFL